MIGLPSLGSIEVKAIAALFGLAALALTGMSIYNAGHDAATAALQPKIEQLQSVVATDEQTIQKLRVDAAFNEKLLGEYADTIDTLNQQAIGYLSRLQDLEQHDQAVSDYLNTPIPPALRGLLNDKPAPSGPKHDVPVAAEPARPQMPRASK